MRYEDFLSLAEKQQKLREFARNYPLPDNREGAKKALLENFRRASASLAERKFSEAFMRGSLVEDREAMLEAVNVHGWSLEFASAELRNDREIVSKALEKSYVLQFAGQEFQDGRHYHPASEQY